MRPDQQIQRIYSYYVRILFWTPNYTLLFIGLKFTTDVTLALPQGPRQKENALFHQFFPAKIKQIYSTNFRAGLGQFLGAFPSQGFS